MFWRFFIFFLNNLSSFYYKTKHPYNTNTNLFCTTSITKSHHVMWLSFIKYIGKYTDWCTYFSSLCTYVFYEITAVANNCSRRNVQRKFDHIKFVSMTSNYILIFFIIINRQLKNSQVLIYWFYDQFLLDIFFYCYIFQSTVIKC